jgi:hypothetical protein
LARFAVEGGRAPEVSRNEGATVSEPPELTSGGRTSIYEEALRGSQ